LSLTSCNDNGGNSSDDYTRRVMQDNTTQNTSATETTATPTDDNPSVTETSENTTEVYTAQNTPTQKEEMIFHFSEKTEWGDIHGILIYLYPSNTEGKVNYIINEYQGAPTWGKMFEDYGSTAGEYSDDTTISLNRINMMHVTWTEDGMGWAPESEGINTITVSGGTHLVYHVSFNNGDTMTRTLTRITSDDALKLNNP